MANKPREKKKAGGKKKADAGFFRRHQLVLLLGAATVAALCVVAAVFGLRRYDGAETWLTIPSGATAESVRDSLRTRLGTVEGNRVYMLWRLAGGSPARARGRYRVPHGQFSWRTARNLRSGLQTPVKITWTDVRTMEQLAARVSAGMEFTADEFLEAADSVLSAEGYAKHEYPAAFIPDSYEFYATSSAATVVRRLLSYRNRFWNAERIAGAKALGLTPVEAATVASIVEEESAKAEERPVIARLYLNRLDKGMPLQADPTVKFATGDFALRRITGKHLATDSPFNTYQHKGLPPGPIRIASKQGLEAVLGAPQHKYIYMCAREDFSGFHNFSTDYAEHQRNAARYQAELDRLGIKH